MVNGMPSWQQDRWFVLLFIIGYGVNGIQIIGPSNTVLGRGRDVDHGVDFHVADKKYGINMCYQLIRDHKRIIE